MIAKDLKPGDKIVLEVKNIIHPLGSTQAIWIKLEPVRLNEPIMGVISGSIMINEDTEIEVI